METIMILCWIVVGSGIGLIIAQIRWINDLIGDSCGYPRCSHCGHTMREEYRNNPDRYNSLENLAKAEHVHAACLVSLGRHKTFYVDKEPEDSLEEG